MRSLPLVLVLGLGSSFASGCGGGDSSPESAEPSSSASSSAPGDPEGSDQPVDPAETPACAAVRDGIAAFNEGDYEETVARFVEAVPLAEEQVDGSRPADQLLEAVRWYAELPPEDYPDAAISSPEFAEYKAITLGQCMPVDAPSSDPPGVEA